MPPAICLSDYESFGCDGAVIPFFWPVFDYERLLSQGYGEGFFAFRAPPEIGAAQDVEVSIYDLLFAAVAEISGDVTKVVHIPTLLAKRAPRSRSAGGDHSRFFGRTAPIVDRNSWNSPS